ncbi:DUF6531 domain-containing protein [Chondromyces apiculatus]|uniref:Uncharacterized protein n=1 Tax=Chondromyces apiculatus DSM 436 TaxID=1192034 RepID=A0A017STE0_9BACT|nr:DUF6531 domain-containing protein [Chondromyces apiculatus]EYF00234.1 Hypothetical protein CAP_1048 [Chondromyces apiculatus DSM 436]
MARTAPIPNIPAIPGMNPGAWIMGGGGSDGGSGGKGGRGSGANQGASGNNGGNGPNGGGKNAGSCGPGSGGGCPNPSHGNASLHAGDPIDPVTGRVYTVAVVDLALPGMIPLVIARSYSSSSRETDIGLGFGWTHSLAWALEERRRTLYIHQPAASTTETARLEAGNSAVLPCGRLMRHAWGYTIDADGVTRVFSHRHRGTWLLTRIVDANDNRIELLYEGGILTGVLDSVGRLIRLRRGPDGRIAAFEVKNASARGRWTSFRSYVYDERGDLVAATDGEGFAAQFAYDAEHRLTRRREPGGLTAEFVYDAQGRCIETWCHREGRDGLDADVPPLLADGRTVARGFLHVKVERGDDVTEIIGSRSVRRVEGNALDRPEKSVWSGGVHTYRYDGAGHVLAYADALGSTWLCKRDDAGRLLQSIDPTGSVTAYEYDVNGFIVGVTDALGGHSAHLRDQRGNVVEVRQGAAPVLSFQYDERGQVTSAVLPSGATTRMAYDALGNRVLIVEPDGATRTLRYNFLGQLEAYRDERGLETHFTYDGCGRLRSVREFDAAMTIYEYDADGNTTRVIDPDGRATTLVWGGLNVVTEVRRPDGATVRYFYDREQDLVRIVNECGEEHRLLRVGEGRVGEERTFDGRVIAYKHDMLGRIVQARDGGRVIDFVYDPLGRLLERKYSDERADSFAYDAIGRLIRAATDQVVVEFTYDGWGRITREITHHRGQASETTWIYDALGKPVAVQGPGGAVRVRRDAVGRAIEVAADGVAPLQLRYDGLGVEIERVLPQGGRVVAERTALGMPKRRSVFAGGSGARTTEPEWVGVLAPGETFRRFYDWSAAGLLGGMEEANGERVDLLRDQNGRVIERRRSRGGGEAFVYGPSGDLYARGEAQRFAPGGRPIDRGAVRFSYDALGRVIEKHVLEDGIERTWTFAYDDRDLLLTVHTPDGVLVAFTYDVFARRLEKRVERDGQILSETRYAWRGDVLVHEVREDARKAGDPIVEERSYLVEPDGFLPLAQREVQGGESTVTHFILAPNGSPELLVDGAGKPVTVFDTTHAGRVLGASAARTPLRMAGQYEDEETGLHYNRFRYYDPLTASFLSPEPLGIAASLKAYAYADFRLPDAVDPDGRASISNIFGPAPAGGGPRPTLATGQSGQSGPLHPAVVAALPPNDATPPGMRANNSVGACSEPRALSNYLHEYEWNGIPPGQRTPPPPRSCRPGDPNWQQNLGGALNGIDPNDGIVSGRPSRNWPACENCSQMIPRLYTLANQTPPNSVCAVGTAGGRTARAFNPAPSFTSNPANTAYNGAPPAGAPAALGTWEHNGTGWNRIL